MMTKPWRILVVEDDKHDYQIAKRALAKNEPAWEITWAQSGGEALQRLATETFEVALLDFQLPDLSGLETLQRIRAQGLDVPALIVTGAGSEPIAVAALKAGAEDYLVKDPAGEYLNLLPVVISKARRQWEDRQARHRAEGEVKQRQQDLLALSAVIAAVNRAPDLQTVLNLTLKQIVSLLEVDGAECHLAAKGSILEFAAHYGLDPEFVACSAAFSFATEVGIPGEVLARRAPAYVADATSDERYLRRDLARAAGYLSLICVPIIGDEAVLGTLTVYTRATRKFSSETQVLLMTIGGHMAVAIERARLYEIQRRQAAQLARSRALMIALSQVIARLGSGRNPDQVMETVGAELRQLGLTCLIALLDPGSEALVIRYASLQAAAVAEAQKLTGLIMRGFPLPRARWPIHAEVVEQRRAVYVRDSIALAAAFLPGFPKPAVERVVQLAGVTRDTRAIYVPLVVADRVVGVLGVWGEGLEEDDIPAISDLGSQAAAVLEAAK